jgi:predicted transcriptional regulator
VIVRPSNEDGCDERRRDTRQFRLAELTADIVSAYVSNNSVRSSDLPQMISEVHTALAGLQSGPAVEELAEPLKPAVPIKKSITPDYLVSLEDGKPYKTLKRHLAKLGLTPDEYRAKWGLPYDYLMVALSYAAKRSELAKSLGLGRKAAVEVAAPAPEPEPAPAPKARGRKPKAGGTVS